MRSYIDQPACPQDPHNFNFLLPDINNQIMNQKVKQYPLFPFTFNLLEDSLETSMRKFQC